MSPAEGTGPENPDSFAIGRSKDHYTDGRAVWDWASKYPPEARTGIRREAIALMFYLGVSVFLAGIFVGLANQQSHIPLTWLAFSQASGVEETPVLNVDFRVLAIFFSGSVGGVTFSIKWLVHAAAKGKWHLDRRYWRLLIPFLGGIYACVVLTFLDAGLIGGQTVAEPRPITISAALAFLVGYFSDGVSGLLSNIANAVFGTLEKK